MPSTEPVEIRRTKAFDDWIFRLRDRAARVIINRRILQFSRGNPGKIRALGSGVFEMKIDFGPGYRVYYTQRGSQLILLLCGGDKHTQPKDIERAKQLAASLSEEE